MKRLRRHQLIAPRGVFYSLVLCLIIMGFGGVGFWLIEPRAHTLTDGLWLAFTTAATVGYGDIVPSTFASRAFAVVVVLLGLAVLSIVTASVAAIFVEADERDFEKQILSELHDLKEQLREMRADQNASLMVRPND
jgi:voltage-gated potassium channel